MIFGINTTSDISKLLYIISRAVRRVKFGTILKYHESDLCQISRTNNSITYTNNIVKTVVLNKRDLVRESFSRSSGSAYIIFFEFPFFFLFKTKAAPAVVVKNNKTFPDPRCSSPLPRIFCETSGL